MSFKWQGFQNNSSAAVFKVIQVAGVRNNSATAPFNFIQVAGVQKQLICCSI
jgi:hypothetical protein